MMKALRILIGLRTNFEEIGHRIFFNWYLRPEASDCREACIAASSYEVGLTTGWVCGGVKNGTLFSARGGNSTPADCQLSNKIQLITYED